MKGIINRKLKIQPNIRKAGADKEWKKLKWNPNHSTEVLLLNAVVSSWAFV